jgi:uncharacterized membrane protein YeiB
MAALRSRPRLEGIDLARALAIVGMVSVHVIPSAGGAVPGPYGLAYGRASTLFALVAGIGIALAARRRTDREVRARLVYRAVWLAPVGFALQGLTHPVAVILQYYALWFLLAALVVGLSARALGAVTAAGLVLGPTVLVAAQVLRPAWYAPPGSGAWLGSFGDVLLTGYYPTVSWLWLVLAGLLLGRLDLGSTRIAGALLVGGAAVSGATYAVAAVLRGALDLGRWQPLLDTEGHADTTLETLAAGAAAVAVVGACLLLCRALPGWPLRPAVALGRLALSVYVIHIVVYAFDREVLLSRTVAEATSTTLLTAAVAAVLSTAWLAWRPRGPLEGAERWGFEHLVRPLVRPRPDQHAQLP